MTQAVLAGAHTERRRIPICIAFNVPRVGTIDVEVNGGTRARGGRFFDALREPGFSTLELWAGPVWLLLERNKAVRLRRGTLANLGMAAMAVAGWTEGHFWHLPFLG